METIIAVWVQSRDQWSRSGGPRKTGVRNLIFNLDDYRWLVSFEAEPWLKLAHATLAQSPAGVAALVMHLRRDLSPERAHLVVDQVELRGRAREKFTRAQEMFFTRKGLEQATDEQVAAVKAERFAEGSVADLCCGIGGDLVALATHPSHSVVGVELDPAVAILAEANLRAYRCARASVFVGDAAEFAVADFAAWHVDPDRRPADHRTSQPEHFQPPLVAIQRLLAANSNAAIKLAPASDVPAHWQSAVERQWLGSRGECRQQVVWHGALARFSGLHTATVVDALGGPRTIAGRHDQPIPVAGALGRYLFEPHAAVLAAKLTAEVCRAHGLAAVSSGVAYLTGDTLVEEPACEVFEILEALQLDQKKLRAYCRERNIGRLEIKKRGVHLDPAKLRQAIVASGDNEATLVLTPLAGRVRTLVVRRVHPQA
jgi:hypothetical protein